MILLCILGLGMQVGFVSLGATFTFTNPVIYADAPDNDVIRVGEYFYMISTTMHQS